MSAITDYAAQVVAAMRPFTDAEAEAAARVIVATAAQQVAA